jgi:hypothetical protein
LASARSLFTDDDRYFPESGRLVWWEVWLRRGRRDAFMEVARRLNLTVRSQTIEFPEREVVLLFADTRALQRIIDHCDSVAEFRAAKDTPTVFLDDATSERDWVADLASRSDAPVAGAPTICLLDSGITREHPLLRAAIGANNVHTYSPAWGTADSPTWQGHGTAMAGIALYGDLEVALSSSGRLFLGHGLESVKIIPPAAAGPNDRELYGAIVAESVARVEVAAPLRHRIVCMAVTSPGPTTGRPTSWSASIDALCADERQRRLLILAAGNIRDTLYAAQYPDRNDLEAVEDPGQAWNALTVGACTLKTNLTDARFAGWAPIATAGDIAPVSRTSVTWDRQWPIKPEVVFEGGNWAALGTEPADHPADLSLLTTHYLPSSRLLRPFGDTSAAAAGVSHIAASVLARYPDLWPETVRALVVHSAEWTESMQTYMATCLAQGSRKAEQLQQVIRRYGYGMPALSRALFSAANDVTLLIEDEVRPFDRSGSDPPKMHDMKLHQLPWPRDELLALGEAPAELRVTLSYFVEPNPGERGWTRNRYPSHGLRFAVKRAEETIPDFRARRNRAAREADEGNWSPPSLVEDPWVLGAVRDVGSIHSDTWKGTAADLAGRDAIAVVPVSGWWKEKPHLRRWNSRARYALVVTLRVPNSAVDIYTAIETKISTQAEVEIEAT